MAFRSILRISQDCYQNLTSSILMKTGKSSRLSSDFTATLRQLRQQNQQIRRCESYQLWQGRVTKAQDFVNNKLTILSVLFARQFKAIAVQRIRRTLQISNLYGMMGYDSKAYQRALQEIGVRFLRSGRITRLGVLCSAAIFNWEKERVEEEEIHRYNHCCN